MHLSVIMRFHFVVVRSIFSLFIIWSGARCCRESSFFQIDETKYLLLRYFEFSSPLRTPSARVLTSSSSYFSKFSTSFRLPPREETRRDEQRRKKKFHSLPSPAHFLYFNSRPRAVIPSISAGCRYLSSREGGGRINFIPFLFPRLT